MKCKIRGHHLKIMAKSVRVLAKISDFVFITTTDTAVKLQAVNEHKSAYFEIDLKREFFDEYDNSVTAKCKLHIKSLSLVFRLVNIDKLVETCTLIMDNSMPHVIFLMKCYKDVTREYFLPYMDCERLQFNTNLDNQFLAFEAVSKMLSEASHLFGSLTDEITIRILPDRIKFKTYTEDDDRINYGLPTTSFEYMANEFHSYNYSDSKILTFNVRDLKAFLELTLYQNQLIRAYVESSGKPITFCIDNNDENYSSKIILATFDIPYLNNPTTSDHLTRTTLSYSDTDQTPDENLNRDNGRTNASNIFNDTNDSDSEQENNNLQTNTNVLIHTNNLLSDENNLNIMTPRSSNGESVASNPRITPNQTVASFPSHHSTNLEPNPSLTTNMSNISINRNPLNLNEHVIHSNWTNEYDEMEDEEEYDRMLSGLLVTDNPPKSPANDQNVFNLTGSPLARYHREFLFGTDDEPNPVTSQDIIVPDSDED